MNTKSLKQATSIFSVVAIATLTGQVAAQAQTVDAAGTDLAQASEFSFSVSQTDLAQDTDLQLKSFDFSLTQKPAAEPLPVPGTTETTAAALETALPAPSFTKVPSLAQTSNQVAQVVDPGRATRGGSSYIGGGINIGFTSDDDRSALGRTAFTVYSKLGLTQYLSVRPALFIRDDVTLMVPITYDFSIAREPFAEVAIAPFAGVGVGVAFGETTVGPVLTGGVDFPLSPQFTATAQLNVGFFDNTDVGVILGVGYNFTGLFGLQ